MSLTKYEEGSLRELWKISLPLMLTSLSLMLMIFVDRLLLAKYSTAALNAATNATTIGWGLQLGWFVLAGIGEVFVAQYNGSQTFKKIGPAVWQMIWLAAGSVIFFVPIGLWGTQLIFHDQVANHMERDYFSVMMFAGPAATLCSAVSAFWIGRGKTGVIALMAVLANVLNVCLDIVLIFGIEGVVPSMGVKGAAIATSVGVFFQAGTLFVIFLNKTHRQEFGTNICRYDFTLFWKTVKIGFPSAISVAVEILGWAAFYSLMTNMGEDYITVAAICQSVAILFWFLPEGVCKAIVSIAGNFIGAKRTENISKMMYSGFKLQLIFLVGMILLIVPFTDVWIREFLDGATQETVDKLSGPLSICLLFVLGHVFIEGVKIVFTGVLMAAGDTPFLLACNSISIWLLMYLPAYVMLKVYHAPIELAIFHWVTYSILSTLICYARFRFGAWRKLAIT